MPDQRLLGTGTPSAPPASPASTISEWAQPSTTGMGTTVSSPIFTPQESIMVPKASTLAQASMPDLEAM
eukprot:6133617-Alexandrium_andersonii.AAC.1